MLNWKTLAAALMLTLMSAFAFACSSDSNDDNGDGDEPQMTATMAADGEEPTVAEQPDGVDQPDVSGGGTATLTVGDETYTFDGYRCAFGTEETQNENVDFSSTAFGESATGARTQLSVDITLGTHAVTLNDIDDFENPSVALEAIGGFELQIDGKNISAEASFDDGTTDEIESVAGTFEGTCP